MVMSIENKSWSRYTEAEINKMKGKCKKCAYSSGMTGGISKMTCDYLLITGHSRGVRVQDCEHNKDDKKEVALLRRKNMGFCSGKPDETIAV